MSQQQQLIRLEKHPDNVFVLHMRGSPREDGGFENKLNDEFITAFHAALDECVRLKGENNGGAVVTICDNGTKSKHYSDGLDINYLLGLERPAQLKFLKNVEHLLLRLLTFPMPTVAALNGHTYAGGFLLAMAHDHRVMNSTRGFCCMTEIDLQSPLTPGFNALFKAKVPPILGARMMTEAIRVGANEMCDKWQVVTAAVPNAEVLPAAVKLAASLAPKGASSAMSDIKIDLYLEAVHVLKHADVLRPKL